MLYRLVSSIYRGDPSARQEFRECMRDIWLVFSVIVACAGCSHTPPVQSSSRLTVIRDSQALPEPNRNDLTAADRPALIGPLDTIQVDVFNIADLSREMQVDSSGRIAMPLAGTIDAGGKTAEELARSIEEALRKRYVRNPEVTVNIRSSVSQVVTVDGQVVEPGLYPVTNQMTLMRVIASAKGLSEFARQEDVVILRTVNSQKMAGLYSLAAIRSGVYDDPAIYANDIVIIGDSPQRRLFRDFIALSPVLVGPLIAILR
jgi:polysaccharide biosynthesis/export protein